MNGNRSARTALAVAAVIAALLVVFVSAGAESSVDVGRGWTPGQDAPPPQPDEQTAPERQDTENESPYGVQVASAIGLLVVLLVAGALALFGLVALVLGVHRVRAKRDRVRTSGHPEDADDGDDDRIAGVMHKAVVSALTRLDARRGGDPGDAVVEAWLALEDAAADVGARREAHQTPTEFTASVLGRLDVDADALDRLCRVYHRARFSGHPVTEADARTASDALTRVVTDLDASRTPATAR